MLLGVLLKRRLWRSSSGSDGGDAGGDPIMVYTALLLRLRPLPGMTTTGETAANLAAVISCCFCWRKVSWLLPQRDARGVQWVSGKGGMKWVKEKKGPVKMTFTWIQKRGLLKKEEEKKRKEKGNGREKELVFSRIFISNFFFFLNFFFFNSSYVSQKIKKKRIDCIIRSTCTSFIAQFQRTLSPGYVVISVFGDLFMPFEPAVNTSTSNSCCCCCHVKPPGPGFLACCTTVGCAIQLSFLQVIPLLSLLWQSKIGNDCLSFACHLLFSSRRLLFFTLLYHHHHWHISSHRHALHSGYALVALSTINRHKL